MSCNNYSSGCVPPVPYNRIAQAVNDALACRIDELNGYATSAAQSALQAAASAVSAAQSSDQAKAYRDQAQQVANTATGLVPALTAIANQVQETAELLDNIANTASSYTIRNWFYTAVGGESTIVIPSNVAVATVQAIYIEGIRQDSGQGFVYDTVSRTITLAEPIPAEAAGSVLTVQLGQNNADSPETALSALATGSGAGLVGTASGGTVQSDLDDLEENIQSNTSGLADLRNGNDPTKGDALIPVVQPYAGAVQRTQHNVNAQNISILDFLGDAYSSSTDAAAAFTAANTLVPKGKVITVPAGTYLLNSVVDCLGRHFVFEEPVVFTGSGYLSRAMIHRYNGSNGSMSISSEPLRGSDGNPLYGANIKIGNTAGNVSGLQVGGGNPVNGTDGIIFFPDGSPNWVSVQTGHYPGPTEFAVQPASKAGRCQTVSGTNQVTVLTGPGLTSDDVGKTVWLKDAGYVIATVGSGTFTVTAIGGGTVSFPSNVQRTYICCYIWGRGKCNTNGTAVTRISGDPFVPLNNIVTTFVINGVTTTQSAYTDSFAVTLAATVGVNTNVDYYWWGSVDNLSAAIRLHRMTGGGYEENCSLIAFAKGYYHLHAAGGGPDQLPLYLGVGFDSDGTARRQITIDGDNGIVTIGGSYGRASAEFGYRQNATGDVNRFRFDSGTTGNPAALSAVGPDTNVNVTLAAKGTGFIQTNSEVRFNAAMYPNVDNAYTVGKSGLRVSQFWGANATIQTSDGKLKFDITESDLGIEFVRSVNPVSYKFIEGGKLIEEVETDEFDIIDEPVTEIVEQSEEVYETRTDENGVKTLHRSYKTTQTEQPVTELIDVYDENGNLLKQVSVPKTRQVKVPRKTQQVSSVTGKRTHYGFIAQQIKEAIDKLGIKDFGGYVEGEDGTLGLRYEEFIAPLYKAVYNIDERLQKIEDALNNK